MTVPRPFRAGRAVILLCGLVTVIGSERARAGDAIVTRPGIGCRSSAALAALTMHGGDSRTHRADASASDLRTASEGGCRDLVLGQRLTILRAFRNTAIVTAEKELDGGYGVLVVPAIDLGGAATVDPTPAPSTDPHGASLAQRDPEALSAAMGMKLRQITARYPAIRCYQTSCDFGPESTPQPLCPAATRCENLDIFVGNGVVVGFSADLDPDGYLRSLARSRSVLGRPRHRMNRSDGSIRMRTNSLSWTVAGLEIDYILYKGLDSYGHALNKHTILVAPPDE